MEGKGEMDLGTKRTIKKSKSADVILLEDAFNDFIDEKEARNLSPATIFDYKQSFNKFKQFIDGDTVDSVNQGIVYKWIAVMKQDGIKHSSINHYLRDVRTFLNWCMMLAPT